MERIEVIDAVHEILRIFKHNPKIELQPNTPTGPLNRVAENSLAKKLMGREPKVMFKDGLRKTIDWHVASKKQEEVAAKLEGMLTER
jgi:nucleoside-diphosphate-sugar epimerase